MSIADAMAVSNDGGASACPWKQAVLWLLFLGPFFFASYGFANWVASHRTNVGAIVFAWERQIPFLACW